MGACVAQEPPRTDAEGSLDRAERAPVLEGVEERADAFRFVLGTIREHQTLQLHSVSAVSNACRDDSDRFDLPRS